MIGELLNNQQNDCDENQACTMFVTSKQGKHKETEKNTKNLGDEHRFNGYCSYMLYTQCKWDGLTKVHAEWILHTVFLMLLRSFLCSNSKLIVKVVKIHKV